MHSQREIGVNIFKSLFPHSHKSILPILIKSKINYYESQHVIQINYLSRNQQTIKLQYLMGPFEI